MKRFPIFAALLIVFAPGWPQALAADEPKLKLKYATEANADLLAAHVEDPIAPESCSNDNVEWARVRLGAERDLPIEVAQGSGWQASRTDIP